MKIESWPCRTTHSACNCVLQRLYRLEKEIKALSELEILLINIANSSMPTGFIHKDFAKAIIEKINKARQG